MKRILFFNHKNTIDNVTEEEKEQQFSYLESIKAFARATYTSIYVIDYMKQGFEYVSDNPLFLCGNTPNRSWKWDMPFILNTFLKQIWNYY